MMKNLKDAQQQRDFLKINPLILCGIEGGAALHFIDEIPNSTIRFKKIKMHTKLPLMEKINEIPYKTKDLEI